MHLQTDRLILRPFTPEDLPEFCEINADAEVMRFFFAPKRRWKPQRCLPGGRRS